MLEEILKKCYSEETFPNESSENIKTTVLSRIEEERPMKHFSIKPFVISAVAVAAAAMSVVTANAATDGEVVEKLSETFSIFVNGKEITGTITYASADGEGDIDELADADGNVYYVVDEGGEEITITVADPGNGQSCIAVYSANGQLEFEKTVENTMPEADEPFEAVVTETVVTIDTAE